MKIGNVKIRRVHVKNMTYSKPHGNPKKAYDRKKERRWKPEND